MTPWSSPVILRHGVGHCGTAGWPEIWANKTKTAVSPEQCRADTYLVSTAAFSTPYMELEVPVHSLSWLSCRVLCLGSESVLGDVGVLVAPLPLSAGTAVLQCCSPAVHSVSSLPPALACCLLTLKYWYAAPPPPPPLPLPTAGSSITCSHRQAELL